MADREDLSLDEDIAEIHREGQKIVDEETRIRGMLADVIARRVAYREKVAAISPQAVAFIDNYVHPTVANPAPLAPEVAAPPPAEEPPVFTTVGVAELSPETTSGGAAPVVDEAFDLPEAPVAVEPPPAGEGEVAADGAAETGTGK